MTTCTEEDYLQQNDAESPFPVSEAKAFFEETMMRAGQTGQKQELAGLATEFTPLWNKTVLSEWGDMVAVDVTMAITMIFQAGSFIPNHWHQSPCGSINMKMA
ncbi:hypothetical protein AGMMS49525_16440 [Bacteroidia bacterium]|nr:hypothetical protein AGMMS49525_16440 [Bacteroidia bacterium]